MASCQMTDPDTALASDDLVSRVLENTEIRLRKVMAVMHMKDQHVRRLIHYTAKAISDEAEETGDVSFKWPSDQQGDRPRAQKRSINLTREGAGSERGNETD